MKNTGYRILIILLIIGLSSFIVIESLIFIEGRKREINEVDYAIVLGARLYGDKPAPALERRLKAASAYLEKNEDVNVVVSGGQGDNEDIPEAEAMAKYLVHNGIAENRIIIEDKSTSTFENLKFSLDILRDMGGKEDPEVLIVTNDYHLFRAKFLAKRLGMKAYGLAAETTAGAIVPSYVREYFAVIKSFFVDW